MTLLKSLFLGYPGNYQLYNIPISIYRKGDEFDMMISRLNRVIREENAKKNPIASNKSSDNELLPLRPFTVLGSVNSATSLLSQQYFFTFIHEMGHALAIKLLQNGENPNVTIYLDERDCHPFKNKIAGVTTHSEEPSDWKSNVILAAGPLSECILSGVQCLAVAAIGRYLPSIVAKSMYFCVTAPFFSRSINSINCFGNESDFARIRKNSYTALALATALVAGNAFVVIALGRQIDPDISF